MRRLLAALLLPLAVPASAPAAEGFPTSAVAEGGLALVEDGAMWIGRSPGGSAFGVIAGGPDVAPRVLQRATFTPGLSSNGSVATLAHWRVWTGTAGDGLRMAYEPPGICRVFEAESDGEILAA
ncbi:MAG: hypothetical protein M3320_08160, partial [Actinomycetota bacterium]|nr:hypothetical protein [Actinomycetota bacterium]